MSYSAIGHWFNVNESTIHLKKSLTGTPIKQGYELADQNVTRGLQ